MSFPGQLDAPPGDFTEQSYSLGIQFLDSFFRMGQVVQLIAGFIRKIQDRLDVLSILTLQGKDQIQPIFHLAQSFGIELYFFHVIAQVSADFSDFIEGGLSSICEIGFRCIDFGDGF